jgi:hypothetical protein
MTSALATAQEPSSSHSHQLCQDPIAFNRLDSHGYPVGATPLAQAWGKRGYCNILGPLEGGFFWLEKALYASLRLSP